MNWSELSATERDSRAWAAICGWPEAAGWDPLHLGLDHGRLARCLLWDKVGCAVRRAVDPAAQTAFEGEVVSEASSPAGPASADGGMSLRGRLLDARRRARQRLGRPSSLFCPFPYSRHARIIEGLLERERKFEITVPVVFESRWPGAVPVPVAGVRAATESEVRLCVAKLGAILGGLREYGIVLLPEEASRLEREVWEQQSRLREAAATLETVRPSAVLLPADNHPPFIEYAEVARREGVPVVMLQHGLDCERYFLDEGHASHIAVWGPERRDRYEKLSSFQPEFRVVGNPAYDVPVDNPGRADPLSWVWVTRPHRPAKCYLPSRSPSEGLEIFDALSAALERVPGARLIIKPHPFDYETMYRARIIEKRLSGRIEVIHDRVEALFTRAGVVITEDSTAGMDAMRLGRVIVHAHFAPTPPVTPFAAYGAALPGYSAAELADSLERAGSLSSDERARMRDGQERFLDDFAGPRDGQAAERFVKFVGEVLST